MTQLQAKPSVASPDHAGGSRETAGSEPVEADPPEGCPLIVDVVLDDEDRAAWVNFGDAVASAEAASLAVGAWPGFEIGPAAAVVALSTNAEVQRLNAAYRGLDKPTNVLSFPAPAQPSAAGERPTLGDIIIAGETVLREAAEQGIPPAHHLQHLVVHGLLHLIGYDHVTGDEAAAMEGLESRILATLGIADPYADPPLLSGEA